MSVIRINKTQDYTVMSNHHFRNKDMSLKAKGLLSMMLSLPNGWDYSVRGLSALNKDGEESINSAIKELEKFGYVKREQSHDASGKFCGYNYTVYESPYREKPFTEKPLTENRQQLNTKELNTKELNICSNDLFERLWSKYPKKRGKGQVSDKAKKRICDIGEEHMLRAIERYKKENTDIKYMQNGSTFFTSGFIDYLDENYEEIKQTPQKPNQSPSRAYVPEPPRYQKFEKEEERKAEPMPEEMRKKLRRLR